MDAIQDFEDLLEFLSEHGVRYLIVGGLAFIYHAKPRFTKDIDIWIDPCPENVARANAALSKFGSPALIDAARPKEILQIEVAPNQIDILLDMDGFPFTRAWKSRIEETYGRSPAIWIDLDSLIEIAINNRHSFSSVRIVAPTPPGPAPHRVMAVETHQVAARAAAPAAPASTGRNLTEPLGC